MNNLDEIKELERKLAQEQEKKERAKKAEKDAKKAEELKRLQGEGIMPVSELSNHEEH